MSRKTKIGHCPENCSHSSPDGQSFLEDNALDKMKADQWSKTRNERLGGAILRCDHCGAVHTRGQTLGFHDAPMLPQGWVPK